LPCPFEFRLEAEFFHLAMKSNANAGSPEWLGGVIEWTITAAQRIDGVT
jgi:hypothetical protein